MIRPFLSAALGLSVVVQAAAADGGARSGDTVPLEILARHLKARQFGELEFLALRDGRLQLTIAAREILGLDDATAAAIDAIYCRAYGQMRGLLAAHPPRVEVTGTFRATMTFADMAPLLEPLRIRIDKDLAALIAAGRLTAAQEELIHVVGDSEVERAIIHLGNRFGSQLQTITLTRRVGSEPALWEVAIRCFDGCRGMETCDSLVQEYRFLLDFVDFGANERLPANLATSDP